MEVSYEYVSVEAVCFDKEEPKIFKTMFKLGGGVVESESSVDWENDGTLIL